MFQSKLTKENLNTDSARANAYAYGHQIVFIKTIVNNKPKTIYYQRNYST
ncbi:MAG TPA: hypothetical protein VIG94_04470 [Faecalibacter sp.]